MQTSSIQQQGLVAALALGLGFSLASSDAVGYPSGPSVSLGENAVRSFAGKSSAPDITTALMTVPEGQAFLITDLSFTATGDDHCEFRLIADSGSVLFSNWAHGPGAFDEVGAGQVNRSLNSGIKVQPGQTISLQTFGSCEGDFHYNVGGTLVQA